MRFLLLVLIATACGDASQPPDARVVVHLDAQPDTSTDGPLECNGITDVGTIIERTRIAQDMPAPTGGTIPEGTYTATAWNLYTGPSGATGGDGSRASQTSVVAGGYSRTATTDSNGNHQWAVNRLDTSGTSVTITQMCPIVGMPVSRFIQFSQAGNVVTLFDPTAHEALVYTLMP